MIVPHRHRRARMILGVCVLVASTALVGSEASAAPARAFGWRPFTRTVEPWIPGLPPSTPPIVDLAAACVRWVGGGQLEAVFGYDNPDELSVYAGLDQDTDVAHGNVIVRNVFSLRPPHRTVQVEDTGPQATLFLPGRHPHVFAVRFRLNERVAWQVRIPSSDEPQTDPGWKVTVRPRLFAPCGPRVPDHFAVVQTAGVFESPVNIVRDEDAHITGYDMAVGVVGVRTVCSADGSPLPFRDVVGWTNQPNVVPLRTDEIIRHVVAGNAVFEMTRIHVRAVLDVSQPVGWFGPIADVTGRCRFGRQVVRSDVFWAGLPATGTITPTIVDGAVVDLVPTLVLPGGNRIR
jgi:hypothetical protein